jgi:predicted ATPase
LEAAELVFTRGAPPEATYVFKHALVQDAAYQSLLMSSRQFLHRRIAESLTNRFPDRAEEEPSLVAHHFTQAGMPDAAIEWWERAGSQAMRRFANPEAVVSFGNALSLVPDVPSGAARDERELALRLAIGPALLAADWATAKRCSRARAGFGTIFMTEANSSRRSHWRSG